MFKTKDMPTWLCTYNTKKILILGYVSASDCKKQITNVIV